jgi:hypothetical protein
MHNQTQRSDGSSRFVEGETALESLRLSNGGAEWYDAQITFGAEGAAVADRIDITIQLLDRAGRSIKSQSALIVWPAVADGTKVASAVTTVTVLTGVLLFRPLSPTASAHIMYPDVNGVVSVGFTQTGGAATRTCCVMLPDGRVIEGATMTWA